MTKDIDPFVKSLLEAWGRLSTSELLGFPPECPMFRDVQTGYRDSPVLSDLTEAERVGTFIDLSLSKPLVDALKCEFRYKFKPHKAKKHCGCELWEYRSNLASAIKLVTNYVYAEQEAKEVA